MIFSALVRLAALIVLLLLGGIIVSLIFSSWPSIQKFGFSFLWTKEWDAPNDIYGALVPIYGTLVTSFIALLIAGPAGGEEILPRLPVAQRKQLRLLGGIGQRQQPAVAKPSFTRCVSRRRYLLIAQASQLMPVINHQAAAFCRSQQSLLELTLQRSRFGVQCAQRRLLLGSQRRPGVNKTLPRQGQETIGLAVQRQRVALLVDAVHALKQGRIKPDVIPQLGEFGGKLFIQ